MLFFLNAPLKQAEIFITENKVISKYKVKKIIKNLFIQIKEKDKKFESLTLGKNIGVITTNIKIDLVITNIKFKKE